MYKLERLGYPWPSSGAVLCHCAFCFSWGEQELHAVSHLTNPRQSPLAGFCSLSNENKARVRHPISKSIWVSTWFSANPNGKNISKCKSNFFPLTPKRRVGQRWGAQFSAYSDEPWCFMLGHPVMLDGCWRPQPLGQTQKTGNLFALQPPPVITRYIHVNWGDLSRLKHPSVKLSSWRLIHYSTVFSYAWKGK